MQLSVETYSAIKLFGEEQGLNLLKESGFEAIDYSFYDQDPSTTVLGSSYKERAKHTKELLNKLGLSCYQTHGPARKLLFDSDYSNNNPDFVELIRSIEYSAIIGAKTVIVHPAITPQGPESQEHFEFNLSFYSSLQPYAEKFGIKIGVENMIRAGLHTPTIMKKMIDKLPKEHFCVCLDMGHASCCHVNPEDFISKLEKGRIEAIHVHDNNGDRDAHLLPHMGHINWDSVIEELAKANFQGNMNLEIEGYIREMKTYEEGLSLLRKASAVASELRASFLAQKN